MLTDTLYKYCSSKIDFRSSWIFAIVLLAAATARTGIAADGIELSQVPQFLESMTPEARKGYELLLTKAYLPADLDDKIAAKLAQKIKLREQGIDPNRLSESSVGAAATEELDSELSEEDRQRLYKYYGLTKRPSLSDSSNSSKDLTKYPMQYAVQPDGQWSMNCLACHGGSVYGTPYPGAPNNSYDLQTLIEDIRIAKLEMSRPLGHMEVGSLFMPLGNNIGTTNAVMFGVALMHFRDADLNVMPLRPGPKMLHHDMDPPAWWAFSRKHHIYIDGFAQKGHRGLMQFMLVRQNGPEKFREWEEDFKAVYQFLSELKPPTYPHAVDENLAGKGKLLFQENCSSCHGTYSDRGGSGGRQVADISFYPELMIPLDEIGTDPVRWKALTPEHRRHYGESWFADNGAQQTVAEPAGYVAPPLDGVWATAPYLHNGSVPTLWHLLNPEDRPRIWRRTTEEMDEKYVGLRIETLEVIPAGLTQAQRRRIFDTTQLGKKASGHDFPSVLTIQERLAVLEYLKTL